MVITLLLTVGVIAGTRGYFNIAVKNIYKKDQIIEIGELIGLDVDMAQILARELKVKLEFIPFDFEDMAAQLKVGLFDFIMSGITATTPRLTKMTFSEPYFETTLGFIVRDHRRKEFATRKAVKSIPKLRIGVPHEAGYFMHGLKTYLPQSEIIQVESIEEFFESNKHQLDALLLDAESGSAWTLRYPRYKVVVPVPDVSKVPIAYPVALHDIEFADFLSQWIKLKKHSMDFPVLYDHWILGLDAEPKHPRWSIIRNVLGWIE